MSPGIIGFVPRETKVFYLRRGNHKPYPYMAKISFLLKEPGATQPTPIFAYVSFDGQRIEVV